MYKQGDISWACIVKFAFCQESLNGEMEWNVNYTSCMQLEKTFAGNKLYVMYEGQEDVSLFLQM